MIYITGDTHGNQGYNGGRDLVDKLSTSNFPEGNNLSKKDYIIITGDFGFIFSNTPFFQPSKEEKYWLDWLDQKPWTTLFVDGNHENFERLYNIPEIDMFGEKVGAVNDSVFHLKRGRIYNINGNKIFTFGGAKSIDKHMRTEGISWWPLEEPTTAEMMLGLKNLESVGNKVDYIITHTAPSSVATLMDQSQLLSKYQPYALTKYLDTVKSKVDFKKWYFGHFHDDEEFEEGKFVLLYKRVIPIG
jgi:hypothetical protein